MVDFEEGFFAPLLQKAGFKSASEACFFSPEMVGFEEGFFAPLLQKAGFKTASETCFFAGNDRF